MRKSIYRFLYFTNFVLLVSIFFTSCSVSKQLKKADKKYESGEYKAASNSYRKVIRRIPEKKKLLKAEVNYKLGNCYSKINLPGKAVNSYQAALKLKFNEDPFVYLKLAKVQLSTGRYKDAEKNFKIYLKKEPNSLEASNGLASLDSISVWNKSKTRYIVSMAKELNHRSSSSFSAIYMGNDSESLVLTSNRVKGKKKTVSNITGVSNNDIYITRKNKAGKWEPLEQMEGGVNTESDEGVATFSPDGKTMYYTLCSTNSETSRIFKSQRSGGEWTEPVQVKLFLDSTHSAGHPALNKDGDIMYLVSDREGGFGGNDIWYSMFVDGKWGEPINVGGEINTSGDEMFPYVDSFDKLYFSSNGHIGYGGLDIFCATKDSVENWTVQNMKPPFNSSADDFSIVFEGSTNNGYFSSNRKQKRFVDLIYRFDLPNMYFNISGTIVNEKGEVLSDAIIRLVGDNGDNVKIRAKKDGSYKINLNRNVKYVMMASYRGYLNSSHTLETFKLDDSKEFTNTFILSSLTKSVKMDNIFYELGKWQLTSDSEAGLNSLVKMLKDNPNIVMEISSHTDMIGNENFNIELSQKRAQSVIDYLIKEGIEKDRVVPKGYGETNPVIVDNDLAKKYIFLKEGDILSEDFILKLTEDQQNICNTINRRTEFKVIRTTYNLY